MIFRFILQLGFLASSPVFADSEMIRCISEFKSFCPGKYVNLVQCGDVSGFLNFKDVEGLKPIKTSSRGDPTEFEMPITTPIYDSAGCDAKPIKEIPICAYSRYPHGKLPVLCR